MKRCYYAHPITDYGTTRELIDILELEDLGFVVVNPNTPELDAAYKAEGMEAFRTVVWRCDLLAFRAFDDGKIPAGVYKEIQWALQDGKTVIELGGDYQQRGLSVEDTRSRLKALGRKNVS